MARYIDVDKTIAESKIKVENAKLQYTKDEDFICRTATRIGWNFFSQLINFLENEPNADVKEVVRGKWEIEGQYCFCSECDERIDLDYDTEQELKEIIRSLPKFCGDCGADMRGK